MASLFITPTLKFEKIAGEVALPEDPNSWTDEILNELYKQAPFVADFAPHVVMDNVDAEAGYGFGNIEVSNKTEMMSASDPNSLAAAGVNTIKIPVVVKDNMLQPLDVLVTADAKILPLTESRLRKALFRAQNFDMTSKGLGDQGLINQLYPPYRQGFGMGGGSVGMGKSASEKEAMTPADYFRHGKRIAEKAVKNFPLGSGRGPHGLKDAAGNLRDQARNLPAGFIGGTKRNAIAAGLEAGLSKRASLLESILPTVLEQDFRSFQGELTDQVKIAAHYNRSARDIFSNLAQAEVTTKTASPLDGEFDAVQVQHTDSGYIIKAASSANGFKAIETPVDRGQLVQLFGEKVALAADQAGSVTMGVGNDPMETGPIQEPSALIDSFGVYQVETEQGEPLVGYVFPSLIDVDGKALPLALFTNGNFSAVQGEISGAKHPDAEAALREGRPQGRGVFFRMRAAAEGEATIPFDIKGSDQNGLLGTTFDGRSVRIAQTPGIQTVTSLGGDEVIIPVDFKWMPLGQTEAVVLVGLPSGLGKIAHSNDFEKRVVIRSGGPDSFSITGGPVEKIAMEASFIDFDQALFLLTAMGVHPTTGSEKLASAMQWSAPIEVKVSRDLTPKQEEPLSKNAQAFIGDLRCNLVKEAATIPDPTAVDTVLSLGFINPENIITFVSYLPTIDMAQEKMCELLFAARLGLQDVPVGALEKAVKAVENVLEGLKIIAFQQG